MLDSIASAAGHDGGVTMGSCEPIGGYGAHGYAARVGRHYLHCNELHRRLYRAERLATVQASERLAAELQAAERLAQPGSALLPAQPVEFIRRHPRYWSNEERDTFNSLRKERNEFESVMRHEDSNEGRAQQAMRAASSVNAASTSSASKRLRVSDAHDARTAKERSKARPYSKRRFEQDCESNMPTRRTVLGRDGKPIDMTCYSIINGERTVFATREEREERTSTSTAKVDHAAAYAKRLAMFGATGQTSK